MRDRTKIYFAALIVTLLTVQLAPFTAGHNLNADDNLYQYLTLKLDGLGLIERAWDKVIFTQRYTQLFGYLLNYLGTAWNDLFPVRVLAVAVFGACFLLIAANIGQHASPRAAAITLLTLPAGIPLAFHHLPPTSYPLLITLPLAAILAVRLRLCRPGYPYRDLPKRTRVAGRTVEALSLATSEYMIIFGGGIMLLSSLSAAVRTPPVEPGGSRMARLVRDRRLRVDAALVLAAIGLQLATVRLLPGQGYHETGLDIALGDFVTVLFRHIVGGLTLGLTPITLDLFRIEHVGVGAVVAVLVFVGAMLAFRWPGAPLRDGLLLPTGLSLAAAISLPIALSAKYQQWCFERGDCVYIDSRLAGLAMMVALAGGLSLLINWVRPQTVRGLVAVLLAGLAGLTTLHNLETAERMTRVTEPWRQAQAYACAFPSDAPARDRELLGQAPSQQSVAWHKDWLPEAPSTYWQLYAEARRTWAGPCPDPLTLNFGKTVQVPGSDSAEQPWLFGWHGLEAWGVWSAGETAALVFQRPQAEAQRVTLWLAFQVFAPPQEATFIVNGSRACRAVLETERVTVGLPLPQSGGQTRVVLKTPDSRAPAAVSESGDTRVLGLGLRNLRLTQSQSADTGGTQVGDARGHAHSRSTTACQVIPASS